jgi:putative CocE/NonD family hydrolase
MRLHLAAADLATADPQGGRLVVDPVRDTTTARWVHDPADLVPSTVADPFSFLREAPDEGVVAGRPDVLTFTSEVFDRPLDLTGPVSLHIGVGSSAPSTAVFAKLVDVAPDGTALMLTRGQVMVRRPDRSLPVRVDLAHLGYRLQAGHRLRVQLASSDFPLYLPHPGTDDDPWRAVEGRTSEQTMSAGGAAEAYLSVTTLAP